MGDKAAAAAKSEIMTGDKLGRQEGGSGCQDRNHEGRRAWQKKGGSKERNHEGRQAWETRRQWQRRGKSRRETSLGDKAAAAAKRETMKETSLGNKAAAAAKSESMKGDNLGRQGGSGSQERNHEGRYACMGDKAAVANFRNQEPSHGEVRTPIASSYLGKTGKLEKPAILPLLACFVRKKIIHRSESRGRGRARHGLRVIQKETPQRCH